jgi:phage shock protein A
VATEIDRDQLLDRLQHLRTILPVFAQELATARRHAAQLRRDNRRLLEEVHRLQREHGAWGSTL